MEIIIEKNDIKWKMVLNVSAYDDNTLFTSIDFIPLKRVFDFDIRYFPKEETTIQEIKKITMNYETLIPDINFIIKEFLDLIDNKYNLKDREN